MKICVKLLLLFFIGTILPVFANALTIDKQVTIQPIQIIYGTDTSGNPLTTNLTGELFEEEMDKIWGQAGIDIEFLSFNQYNSPGDFRIGLLEFPDFFTNAGGKNTDPLTINMWFIGEITFDGSDVLGVSNCGWPPDNYGNLPPANGIAISDIIFGNIPNYYNVMAFDVMAHELGHNLGLYHVDDPYGFFGTAFENESNLMSTYWYPSGSYISDIPHDGNYNLLTDAQILTARNSQFARHINTVPEPATMLLIGLGLAGLAVVRRKFKK